MFLLFASAYSSTPQPPSLSHIHPTFQRVSIAQVCERHPGWYFVRPVHPKRAPCLYKLGWYVHLSNLHLVKGNLPTKISNGRLTQVKRIGEMFPDYSTPLHFASCLHRRVIAEPRERSDSSEGEVSDDTQDRLFCLECRCYLTEAEICARWNEGWDAYVHNSLHSG